MLIITILLKKFPSKMEQTIPVKPDAHAINPTILIITEIAKIMGKL